jgi:WD40 repeat protein
VGTPLALHEDQVLSLAFSRDGKTLASGSADHTVILWDFAKRQAIDTLRDHTHWVVSVAFSVDGNLASGSIDKTVTLRAVVVRQQLGEALTGNKGPVQSATITDNGNLLIAVRPTGSITSLWDFTSNNRLAQPGGYPTVALSYDGQLMALGNKDGLVLFDVAKTQILSVTFAGLKAPVLALAFNADMQQLASSSCGSTDVQGFCVANILQIWDTQSGRLIQEITTSHTDSILSIAFSAKGGLLATGSQDKTIILWDTTTWVPVGLPLAGHTNKVTSLAFSPDGKTLASGGADTSLILWDLLTRQPIGQPFSAHAYAITALAFNLRGDSLLSGDEHGDLFLWTTSPTAWARRVCEIVKRNFTQAEWSQFLALRAGTYRRTCDQWPDGQ